MGLITILFASHIVYVTTNAWNKYEKLNESYWRSTSDFQPIPSTSYGTIQLLQSLRMEFKLIFYDRSDYNNWQNVFRIGYISKDNSCHGYGSRYPSLWLTPTENYLNLGISQQSNCHYGPWPNFHIEKYKLYTITIQFNDTWVYMKINNDTHINERRQEPTQSDIHNTYLHIWISTDTDGVTSQNINMTLSDIVIHTWGETIQTSTNPTNIPSFTPTISPSKSPTIRPSDEPTPYPTGNPIYATLMSDIITTSSTNIVNNETEDIPSLLKESKETFFNKIKNTSITKENLFYLVSGVLLTTFVCLCMIIMVFCCVCCPKKKKKKKRNVKYHIPRNIEVRKPKNNIQYKGDKQSISLASYQCKVNQMQKESLDAIANISNDSNPSKEHSEEEGGVLDENNNGNIEGCRFDGTNKVVLSIQLQENFNNVLNNANAINDIMLNDVINEIETAGADNHQFTPNIVV